MPRSAARRAISRDELPVDPAEMATFLIGCRIVSDVPEGKTVARITETEAYLWNDAAAHSFRGRTVRNASLFLERGHAYVYFIYGNHYCFNVSGDRAGVGAGVLVRAAEPLDGIEVMRARRGAVRDLDLLRGPGRLAEGLGIKRDHDGLDLTAGVASVDRAARRAGAERRRYGAHRYHEGMRVAVTFLRRGQRACERAETASLIGRQVTSRRSGELPRMFDCLRHRPFAVTVVVALVVKLWLTSDIAIIPFAAPYDMSNYVEHAKWIAMGRWFGPYDALTLIKGPTFPLFLALTREFGIPFPFAHQLLYGLASLVACIAIRPIVRDQRTLAACFVLLLFNPDTFDAISWLTYRSALGSSLALLAFSCACALTLRRANPVRRSWPWAIGLGISFSAFWLNREEGLWLVPAVLVALGPVLVLAARETRRASFERSATMAFPVLFLALSIKAICVINGRAYGWPTVVEIQSPEFVSAYAALARISHPSADPRFPVPLASRKIAYAASPAAAELQPVLDGPATLWARTASCGEFSACGDLAGGWFLWAFRQAVEAAGHDRNGATARAFYIELSGEIDRACDAGTIRCERKRSTLAPSVAPGDLAVLVHNFFAGFVSFATFRQFSIDPRPPDDPPEWLVRDYRFVTGSEARDESRRHFAGWIIAPHAATIVATSSGEPDAGATIVFSPSPDVAAAVSRMSAFSGAANFARFDVTTICESGCGLRIAERDGTKGDIVLDVRNRDVRTPNVLYHLDSADSEGVDVARTASAKRSILNLIASLYGKILGWLALFTLWIALCDLANARRARLEDGALLALASVAGLVSVMALLTVVQTLSFPGFTSEYFGSPRPILLVLAAIGLRSIGAFASLRVGTYLSSRSLPVR